MNYANYIKKNNQLMSMRSVEVGSSRLLYYFYTICVRRNLRAAWLLFNKPSAKLNPCENFGKNVLSAKIFQIFSPGYELDFLFSLIFYKT